MFFKTSSLFDVRGEMCINAERENLLAIAESLLGRPYSTEKKNGFDCSSYVRHCYSEIGYSIPRSSHSQFINGKQISRDQVQLGDIIVFKGRNDKSERAGHVGIVHHFEDNKIWFIHASSSVGITYNNSEQSYYKKRLMGFVSVIEE